VVLVPFRLLLFSGFSLDSFIFDLPRLEEPQDTRFCLLPPLDNFVDCLADSLCLDAPL